MRPRKTILLYCDNDRRRMELAYVLRIRGGYLIENLDVPSTPDMALVVHGAAAEYACSHIGRRFPATPLMVVLPTSSRFLDYGQLGCTSLLKSESIVEILEWVRVIIARKRGPKLGPSRKPPAREAVLDELRMTGLK